MRLPVSQLIAHVSEEGSEVGQHSSDERSGALAEEKSAVLQERTDRWKSSKVHGWAVEKGSAEGRCSGALVRGYGPVATEECYQQTCVEGSGTGAAALGPGHVGNWAGSDQSWQESLAHWNWESCSEMNFPQLQ